MRIFWYRKTLLCKFAHISILLSLFIIGKLFLTATIEKHYPISSNQQSWRANIYTGNTRPEYAINVQIRMLRHLRPHVCAYSNKTCSRDSEYISQSFLYVGRRWKRFFERYVNSHSDTIKILRFSSLSFPVSFRIKDKSTSINSYLR